MGQAEIINLLEKSNQALSRTEIAKKLNKDPNTVSYLLNRLLEFGEILYEEIDRIEAMKKYGSNRRMRIYKAKKIKI